MEKTQLIQYTKRGNLQKVKEEIEKGVNINIHDKFGDTALIWASRYGYLDMVKFLISKGAHINHRNGSGNTALIYASMFHRLDVVEFLVSKGANINFRNHCRDTARMLSFCYGGRPEVPEFLASLKGPLSLQHIILNKIDKENISHGYMPDILFRR